MSFLTPFFLIGLGALLVPIIIHMWSKDAKQAVSFGSLRFLRETETRTTRSIMPSQWLLLILRLLLLALIVFLLAGMQFTAEKERSNRMYLVDPVYQNTELLKNLRDTLPEGTAVRWLAQDFPSVDEAFKADSDVWILMSNLPTDQAACIVVISPLRQQSFMGKRKEIASVCQWINPPIEMEETALGSITKNEASYRLRASYDEWSSTYSLEDSNEGKPLEVSYYMEATPAYASQKNVIQSALNAVDQVSLITLKRVESVTDASWVIWLSDETAPENKKLIVADGQTFGWEQITDGRVKINDQLTAEEAIQLELPRKLLDVFVGDYFLDQEDELLRMDLSTFQYKESGKTQTATMEDAAVYLWPLLLIILLIERYLSFKSNRVAA